MNLIVIWSVVTVFNSTPVGRDLLRVDSDISNKIGVLIYIIEFMNSILLRKRLCLFLHEILSNFIDFIDLNTINMKYTFTVWTFSFKKRGALMM